MIYAVRVRAKRVTQSSTASKNKAHTEEPFVQSRKLLPQSYSTEQLLEIPTYVTHGAN